MSIHRQDAEISARARMLPAFPLRRFSSMPTNWRWEASTTLFGLYFRILESVPRCMCIQPLTREVLSGPESAPPFGAHFRLKASFDVSQLSPPAQVVARAMQKYGMFLSDGGNIALTAQDDEDTTTKYADLGFGPHDLQAIKVTDFEVLNLGKPVPLTYECERNK